MPSVVYFGVFKHPSTQPPPPKVDPRKAALFNQVLENVTGLPAPPAVPAAAEAPVEEAPVVEASASVAEAPVAEAAPVEAKPKARKKTKAR